MAGASSKINCWRPKTSGEQEHQERRPGQQGNWYASRQSPNQEFWSRKDASRHGQYPGHARDECCKSLLLHLPFVYKCAIFPWRGLLINKQTCVNHVPDLPVPRCVPLRRALLGGPHSSSPSPNARVAAAAPRAATEAGQGGGEAPGLGWRKTVEIHSKMDIYNGTWIKQSNISFSPQL